MPYIPHTEQDVQEMLATIGVKSIDDLFADVPDELRVKGELDIPSFLDEPKLYSHLQSLADRNLDLTRTVCFLGAGIYDRYIPATVGAVISRGEFLTAYTPYQPEASQGYLQTIYEFQTMVAELFDMEIANASMYDGATSLAEAAILATGVKHRDVVAVSEGIHPHFMQVMETYCWANGLMVRKLPLTDGQTLDFSAVADDCACVIVGYPNFYGIIEDLAAARAAADKAGAMLIVSADPTACSVLPPPGQAGADIVTGEGQPLGIPMGFGGPLLGLFTCKKELVRMIPGRIVGRTTDEQGRWGYAMTLRTREQDIRREKATSNICTNEALMALAATVYMATLGKNGMRQVGESTVRNTQYAIQKLTEAGGRLRFPGKVFGEFVLDVTYPAEEIQGALLEDGILAGLPLGQFDPGLESCLLVAVTELRTKAQIDDFAAKLKATL